MNAKRPVSEYWVHKNFDWDAYQKAFNLSTSTLAAALEITTSGYYLWKKQRVCPSNVWKRCVRTWGDAGLTVEPAVKQLRPFKMPHSYALSSAESVAPPPPPPLPEEAAVPEPTPLPEQVPWEVYSKTVTLLLEHNRELVGENQAFRTLTDDLRAELKRARSEITILRDATPPKTSIAPPPVQVTQVLAKLPTSTSVLSDLESRLGKSLGLH